jgi:hypothetical protein
MTNGVLIILILSTLLVYGRKWRRVRERHGK